VVSYSLWRQNETFLPYTSLAGAGNTTDGGASSPDAEMGVLLLNTQITSRPHRDVTLTGRYRFYGVDNHMPAHTFTNVLSGGGDVTPVPAAVHTAEPIAFNKQNASAEAAWRIIPQITLSTGYEYERWQREHREISDSNENIFKGSLDVRPWKWLQARLKYSHGVRTIGGAPGAYEPPPAMVTALPQFRKFDESDRTRDKGEALLQLTPHESLTLSGSVSMYNDNYFNNSYGVNHASGYGLSGDVTWSPVERVAFHLGYARDQYKSKETSCHIGGGPPAPCNPLDTFTVWPKDTLDTFRVGLDLQVVPSRLDLSLGYAFALGKSELPASGVPGGAAAGQPANFPDTKNQLQIVNAVARFFLTPQWSLKLGYQYERYAERDYTTDGVPPALAGLGGATAQADARSIVLGAQHPPYEAHIVAFSVGYKF
jgi:MtrB/PioB family decaheme-associated outer membrane protein